ncbi:hypothetical protein C5167_008791 [Papaver somniferum]|uniref:Uncharacterized protein n=1 Tax=Papaver somniferum TaxID=3469 RepID=A0A4Y7JYI0_PAPSO|nr:hypothetical protein C5167_008791 [Papaver somniferum]
MNLFCALVALHPQLQPWWCFTPQIQLIVLQLTCTIIASTSYNFASNSSLPFNRSMYITASQYQQTTSDPMASSYLALAELQHHMLITYTLQHFNRFSSFLSCSTASQHNLKTAIPAFKSAAFLKHLQFQFL